MEVPNQFALFRYVSTYGLLHTRYLEQTPGSEDDHQLDAVVFQQKLSSSFRNQLPWGRDTQISDTKRTMSILRWATGHSLVSIVRLGLAAFPKILQEGSVSALLDIAVHSGSTESIKLLYKVSDYSPFAGSRSTISYNHVCKAADLGHGQVVAWYLAESLAYPINIIRQALFYATVGGHDGVVEIILDFNYPGGKSAVREALTTTFSMPDRCKNQNLLQVAIDRRRPRIFRLYINAGANFQLPIRMDCEFSIGKVWPRQSHGLDPEVEPVHTFSPSILDWAIICESPWACSDLLAAGSLPSKYPTHVIELPPRPDTGRRYTWAEVNSTVEMAFLVRSSYFIQELSNCFNINSYRDVRFALKYCNEDVLRRFLDSRALRNCGAFDGDANDLMRTLFIMAISRSQNDGDPTYSEKPFFQLESFTLSSSWQNRGRTLLHHLASFYPSSEYRQTERIWYRAVPLVLKRQDIDVNKLNDDGKSALHIAARRNAFELIDLLLNYPGERFDMDIRGKNEQMPLAVAAGLGNYKAVKSLAICGASGRWEYSI